MLENIVGAQNGQLINRSNSIQRQVDTMTLRIDSMNVKLDRERTRLTKQFVGMEEAIAKIQANLNGLNLSAFSLSNSQG